MKTKFTAIIFSVIALAPLNAMKTSQDPDSQKVLNDALYMAVDADDASKVSYLLSMGAHPDATCPHPTERAYQSALSSTTALMCAASRGGSAVHKLLLEAGANTQLRDALGRNAICYASYLLFGYNYDIACWMDILHHTKKDTDAFYDLDIIEKAYLKLRQTYGRHIFGHAYEKHLNAICKACMEEKVHLATTNKSGKTLLHYMANFGSDALFFKLVCLLYDQGISLDPIYLHKKNNARTPLCIASDRNKIKKCRILVKFGANINAVTRPSALEWSFMLKDRDYTRMLLEYGADVKRAYQGSVPAHANNLSLLEHLLSSKSRHIGRHIGHIVLAPRAETLLQSQEIIKTALLCLKRCDPTMPRDVRYYILAKLGTDIGNLMILKKLRGKPLVAGFKVAAEQALYDATISQLKEIYNQIIKNRGFINNYEREKAALNALEASSKFGTEIFATGVARLAREKLLCNNPNDVDGLLL